MRLNYLRYNSIIFFRASKHWTHEGIGWVLYGAFHCVAQRPGHLTKLELMYLESVKIWWLRKLKKIKWSKKISNEEVFEHVEEKRTLLNNIVRRKSNWTAQIFRSNFVLRDAIERQITVVKGIGRRKTQLLDDVRNRRRYWYRFLSPGLFHVYSFVFLLFNNI